ncbi:hypothetical protein PSPO01_11529 [Paraphaeosphaeria sporulosa]
MPLQPQIMGEHVDETVQEECVRYAARPPSPAEQTPHHKYAIVTGTSGGVAAGATGSMRGAQQLRCKGTVSLPKETHGDTTAVTGRSKVLNWLSCTEPLARDRTSRFGMRKSPVSYNARLTVRHVLGFDAKSIV